MKRLTKLCAMILLFSFALTGCTLPSPTAEPTAELTAEPTPAPTAEPEPTSEPTAEPTPAPTPTPVPTPTPEPDLSQLPPYAQTVRPYGENVLKVPEVIWVPEMDARGCKALYYRIEDYGNKAQYAFAYMGIPAGASAENPCPAVVLVHGGGGTASASWCRYWMDQGFAAISFDWNGDVPVSPDSTSHTPSDKCKIKFSSLGDINVKMEKQWMYHCISQTMIANTLLRSQPEVDADRVGLAGLSWGGLITSIAIGLDNRYAFAIPLYGCGYLTDSHANFSHFDPKVWQLWGPELNFANVNCPVLWISGDNDAHFSADALSRSHEATPGSTLYFDGTYGHGHNWAHPEFFVFAKSVLGIGDTDPVPAVVVQPEGASPTLTYSSVRPITKAVCRYRTSDLIYTSGLQLKEAWKSMDCVIDEANHTVSCTLPEGVFAYYIFIGDDRVMRDPQLNRTVTIGACSQVIFLSKADETTLSFSSVSRLSNMAGFSDTASLADTSAETGYLFNLFLFTDTGSTCSLTTEGEEKYLDLVFSGTGIPVLVDAVGCRNNGAAADWRIDGADAIAVRLQNPCDVSCSCTPRFDMVCSDGVSRSVGSMAYRLLSLGGGEIDCSGSYTFNVPAHFDGWLLMPLSGPWQALAENTEVEKADFANMQQICWYFFNAEENGRLRIGDKFAVKINESAD